MNKRERIQRLRWLIKYKGDCSDPYYIPCTEHLCPIYKECNCDVENNKKKLNAAVILGYHLGIVSDKKLFDYTL